MTTRRYAGRFSADEAARIDEDAALAGLSVSAYIRRALGLPYRTQACRSVVDRAVVLTEAEAEVVDRQRGEQTISAYIRTALGCPAERVRSCKYRTQAERLAARRASWRKAASRRRANGGQAA